MPLAELPFIRNIICRLKGQKKLLSVRELPELIKKLDGEVACVRKYPAKAAQYGTFGRLDERVANAVRSAGIEQLYSHQSCAVDLALSGQDFVVVTPTASGKTLCYNLPVADAVVRDSTSRALYLFPTKALAQDQLNELEELSEKLGGVIQSFTYDGDSAAEKRRIARSSGNVIITNPDMLSAGILPHHTAWAEFFRGLKYVVVDELHSYRGIFGSHLANLFARLERICAFYGSHPVFICCSATIANPREHAEALTGRKMRLIAESGAPEAEKTFMIYSPKLLDRRRDIRRSSLFESARIASAALCAGIPTIVFTRSRLNAELLLKSLQRKLQENGESPQLASGYRGGYLPRERRMIEKGLRNGKIRGVVSTNALELGVDIGALDFAVIHGYPGSVASLRQQAGRAGRRSGYSASVLVLSASPSDKFLAKNPDWLLNATPERARINPSNPYILVSHVRCSAFELPFSAGEKFGGRDITEILEYFAEHGVLNVCGENGMEEYHWAGARYPAADFSLRSAAGEVYDIIDVSNPKRIRVIGSVDKASAHTLVFPGAIYFHAGQSYLVHELNAEKSECYVRLTVSDYYTESESTVRITAENVIEGGRKCGWGQAALTVVPKLYRKIKLTTHEETGCGEIHLPEESMSTTVCWYGMPEKFAGSPLHSSAAAGIVHLLKNCVPVFLMCDSNDIHVTVSSGNSFAGRSVILIADNIPGGVGLAEGAYAARNELLKSAMCALDGCGCKNGCPSCIGLQPEKGENVKEIVHNILESLIAGGE